MQKILIKRCRIAVLGCVSGLGFRAYRVYAEGSRTRSTCTPQSESGVIKHRLAPKNFRSMDEGAFGKSLVTAVCA